MTTAQTSTALSDTDIEKCPFCGGEAKTHVGEHDFNDVYISCSSCDAQGPLMNEGGRRGDDRTFTEIREANAALAIAHWNTRVDATSVKTDDGAKSAHEAERYEDAVSAIMDEVFKSASETDDGYIMSPSPRGLIAFSEAPYPNSVEIASLDAIDRRGGRNILGIACEAADRLGITLTVLASPMKTEWREAPSLDALCAFYESFGFESDFGRDEAWNFASEHLIRHPRRDASGEPGVTQKGFDK